MRSNASGQSVVEYVLMVALGVVIIIVMITLIGGGVVVLEVGGDRL